MHVTACLEGQKEEVEVGEDCRSLQALKQAIVEALPRLWVEGFDVSVDALYLDAGVPIDRRDPHGSTSLFHACSRGHLGRDQVEPVACSFQLSARLPP